jgi:SAM-dependent methyltransferase
MGIDLAQFKLLAAMAARYQPKGRTLMLGRQALRMKPGTRAPINRLLKGAKLGLNWHDIDQADGFSETMWEKFGFGRMETMDLSDYEGATILHDLNHPVPPALHGQFDFIFDGGTIEHVFNVPMALANVFHMLKPGGRFVSANGMNGWVGHGLYQFNPDLVWNFWKRACGCIVHDCRGVARDEDAEDVVFSDVEETGRRLRLRGKLPATRVYLYYEIEKPEGAALSGAVLQSDYRARWSEAVSGKAAE